MNPAEFEKTLMERFPALRDEILEDSGLEHLQCGTLSRYAEQQIEEKNWSEVKRIFGFLEEAEHGGDSAVENAIVVSFLEYFDFGEDEQHVRALMGETLVGLYEEQMRYMEDLKRRSEET